VGRSIGIVIDADDPIVPPASILERSKVKNHETTYRRKDGCRVPVLFGAALLPQPDDRVYIVSTGRDISERKRHDEERERLIGELRQSMARIKTLHGLIPICAVCKRIRDDRGYWNQIESWKRPSGSPARDSPSPPSTPRYPSAGRSRAVTTSPADTRA
jgi:hypothetical protein